MSSFLTRKNGGDSAPQISGASLFLTRKKRRDRNTPLSAQQSFKRRPVNPAFVVFGVPKGSFPAPRRAGFFSPHCTGRLRTAAAAESPVGGLGMST
jgi:hypothetical protein